LLNQAKLGVVDGDQVANFRVFGFVIQCHINGVGVGKGVAVAVAVEPGFGEGVAVALGMLSLSPPPQAASKTAKAKDERSKGGAFCDDLQYMSKLSA
jgi:hypothetical protein